MWGCCGRQRGRGDRGDRHKSSQGEYWKAGEGGSRGDVGAEYASPEGGGLRGQGVEEGRRKNGKGEEDQKMLFSVGARRVRRVQQGGGTEEESTMRARQAVSGKRARDQAWEESREE